MANKKKDPDDMFIKVDGSKAVGELKKVLEELISAPAYTNPLEAYKATLAFIDAPKEEIPVTKEQWAQLYEVTNNIRLLEPWKYLHESERIAILLPGRDEPVYIVVMGIGGMTYGIGIYPGYDSLGRLGRMIENELGENNMDVAFEQHCINLYFGDRAELEPRDINVLKSLGLKFRGKNEWPYFRSMKPGFMPWHMNRDEAALAIASLQNFVMAFTGYLKLGQKVDFENGETYFRFYVPESDMWYNAAVKMPPTPFIQPKLAITDDVLTAKLKKKKKSKAKLGFALGYLPMPIQEEKNKRPKMPRIAFLIDIGTGMPVDQVSDMGSEFIGKPLLDMLARYVAEYGRPASISVKDEDTGCYIADFAEKLDIELIEDGRMAAANHLMAEMMKFMSPGLMDNFPE